MDLLAAAPGGVRYSPGPGLLRVSVPGELSSPRGVAVTRLDVGTTALYVLVPGGVDSVMSL